MNLRENFQILKDISVVSVTLIHGFWFNLENLGLSSIKIRNMTVENVSASKVNILELPLPEIPNSIPQEEHTKERDKK